MSEEHELKCWLEFYEAVESGAKPFEIRCNDRDYRVGDSMLIREWNPYGKTYTGRSCRRLITYMTDWEQKPGYVVLGISRIPSPDAGTGTADETPETDSKAIRLAGYPATKFVYVADARSLERRLNAALADNAALRAELNRFHEAEEASRDAEEAHRNSLGL